MTAKSNAALRLEEGDRRRVQQILDGRFVDAELVRAPEWLNENVIEALFVVDAKPMVMWLCRSGSAQIFDGWDVP